MTSKRGARDSEQLCRAPLVAVGLLVNPVYVPPHSRAEGEILIGLIMILPECRDLLGSIVIRRNVGEIRREKDMFGQDDRATAEEGHGAHGVA